MYSVARTRAGSFLIRHPKHPGLAWSDEAQGWVTHADAVNTQGWAVNTFDTEDEADDYATEHDLYPRRE